MDRYTFVIFYLFLTFPTHNCVKGDVLSEAIGGFDQQTHKSYIDLDSLRQAYAVLISAQHQYVIEFPSTYLEFISLFGYEEEDSLNLYNDSYEYINAFFDGDKNMVMKKSIFLAVEMVWDVDAVSHFQNEFIDFIILNSKEFPYYYSKLKSDEKRKVVQFMIAGYYKNNNLLGRLAGFKFILPGFYKLVQEELENWQDQE